MKRILILTEGQTEERFVKDVLQPHLLPLHIHVEPTILVTKRVKSGPNFKGGIASYVQVRRDLKALLNDTNAALVTTLFDLYGLPADVPDHSQAAALNGASRAAFLEGAMHRDLGAPRRLRPFLMVHEYEALLYCDVALTAKVLSGPQQAATLMAERDLCASPEDIDDGLATHPSQRLARLFPQFRKGLHGPLIAGSIGLESIRSQCPHFAEWLGVLETV